MNKILYLFILCFVFVSCEREEFNESIETQTITNTTAKRGAGNSTVLSLQEHKDMLAWNSLIVGEVMRLDLVDRTYVLNSIDPITKSVSMSDLLNQSLFYDHYVHIATYGPSNSGYDRCGNPDNNFWPPRDPSDPYRRKSTVIPFRVQNLLSNLQTNKTEIFIPNTVYSGNTYSVGHPLVDQIDHTGLLIYFNIIEYNVGIVFCQRHSEFMNVGPANQTNNDFIVLSRPNLDNGNPYSYINFDINLYLQDLGNPGGGGPFIGGN